MISPYVSKAILMAAGLGTRLRPFTQSCSKVLFPVMGIPISQFSVDSLLNSGVEDVIANVHHDAVRTRAGLLALEHKTGQIKVSDESQLLLGSGGAVRQAIQLLGSGPIFYVNGDVLSDVNWEALGRRHLQLRRRWGVHVTLTVFPSGPVGIPYREILFDQEKGLVTGLGEITPDRPFFVGAAVVEEEALLKVPPQGPADFISDIIIPNLHKNKVGIFMTSGIFHDIGTPRLWLDTHLGLIRRLEEGSFPSHPSKVWRTKIEEANLRISAEKWIFRGSSRPKSTARWAGPCYWKAVSEPQTHSLPPRFLGPNAVLYGEVGAGLVAPPVTSDDQGVLESGIGFHQNWVHFDDL